MRKKFSGKKSSAQGRGSGTGGSKAGGRQKRGPGQSRPAAGAARGSHHIARPLPDLPPMPPWNPPEDPALFANYDLPPEVRAGITAAAFTECTPVQAQVLPLTLKGKDIAAQSQTGTGKTAAFMVTIFSRLLWSGPTGHPGPRALIISPTRELTVQIESDARLLGGRTGLSIQSRRHCTQYLSPLRESGEGCRQSRTGRDRSRRR